MEGGQGSFDMTREGLNGGSVRSRADVPITFLPDELLHEILYIVAHSTLGRRASLVYPAVSHVCRYWRHIVLNSPQLWTFISISPHPSTLLLQEYLMRSGDSFLSVNFISFGLVPSSAAVFWEKALMLSKDAHRIVEFYAVGLSRYDMRAIVSSFSSPAPRLHTLHLQSAERLYVDDLFAGQAPSIHDLYLKRVGTLWLPRSALTRLDVDNQPAPALWELLLTLRNSPALEILKLGVYGTVRSLDVPQPQEPVIELPLLRELALTTHVHDDVPLILSYLLFPPSTAVSLRLRGIRNSPFNVDRSCPAFYNMTSRIQDASLELASDNSLSFCVTVESTDPSTRVQWIWLDEPVASDFSHIAFAAMSCTAIQRITLRVISYPLLASQWRSIFSHIPTVVSMDIDFQESMVLEFFLALAPGPAGAAETLICPNLKHLTVSRVNDSEERILEGMTSVIQSRSARGFPFTSLNITMWSGKEFPPSLLSILRGCVEKITINYRVDSLQDVQKRDTHIEALREV